MPPPPPRELRVVGGKSLKRPVKSSLFLSDVVIDLKKP